MNKKAVQGRPSWFSPVWLIPLIAAVVGFWMIFESESQRGPEIEIEMVSAEGIEAGKTLVRARDVEIGRVESVRLAEDFKSAIVTVQMNSDAEPLLTESTQFWVVKPRIARDGVSGLGTIFSGSYIRLEPGNPEVPERSEDEPKRRFQALEEPPVSPADADGVRIRLSSRMAGSLSVGDQVNYRGFPVGQVEEAEFDAAERVASYTLFVKAPYDVLVTENTRFWLTSGVTVEVGSGGLRLTLGSLEALLTGGVTFDVPNDQPRGETVVSEHHFELFEDKEEAVQQGYNRAIEYVLLIDDTIRGLEVGAPVEYRGLRVGTVAEAPYRFYPGDDDSQALKLIPIRIRFEPDRLEGLVRGSDLNDWQERLDSLFQVGLRASLRAGNLLTNTLFVDLGFFPDAEPVAPQTFNGVPVMPTVSSGFSRLESKFTELLDNFNSLPFESLGTNFDSTLAESAETLKAFRETNRQLQELLGSDSTQALPGQLNQTLETLQETLQQFNSDSPAGQNFGDSIEQLNELLRELQPLAEQLNEQPSLLIFDPATAADPQPRAKQ